MVNHKKSVRGNRGYSSNYVIDGFRKSLLIFLTGPNACHTLESHRGESGPLRSWRRVKAHLHSLRNDDRQHWTMQSNAHRTSTRSGLINAGVRAEVFSFISANSSSASDSHDQQISILSSEYLSPDISAWIMPLIAGPSCVNRAHCNGPRHVSTCLLCLLDGRSML